MKFQTKQMQKLKLTEKITMYLKNKQQANQEKTIKLIVPNINQLEMNLDKRNIKIIFINKKIKKLIIFIR